MGKRLRWQRLHDESGNSIVELAIVLLLLIPLFLGMVDFGLGYSTYMTLNNGAREGARWISTNRTNVFGITERAKDEAVAGGIDRDQVTVTYTPRPPYAVGTDVTVTVTHVRPLLFGAIPGLSEITLRASSTMRVLY